MLRFSKSKRPVVSSRSQRGVAAVEMGLMTLILVVAAGGAVELGRAIFLYDTLAKSARAAARFLATSDISTTALETAAINGAKNIALCGQPASCGTVTVVPDLIAANIQARTSTSTAELADVSAGVSGTINYGTIDLVTVTISPVGSSYSFVSQVPGIIPNFNFAPISVTMPRV
jgi:Flp pilus assembly protein TadG